MININKVRQDIIEQITEHTCSKYGVEPEEVKVTFSSTGDVKLSIVPDKFLESLIADVLVEVEDEKN